MLRPESGWKPTPKSAFTTPQRTLPGLTSLNVFSILTRQGLQQAVHKSAQELERFLKDFIEGYNKRCGPFEWTKGPENLRRIIQLTEQWQAKMYATDL
jgi:hypothetical protein